MKGCGKYFCHDCENTEITLEFKHKKNCSLNEFGISICGEDKDGELCKNCSKVLESESEDKR